ncbi:adenine nucleotide alpha hydrolase [Mycobacterium sp. KBS0706]|uniref:adenine nucleotide alpha hydrolase n=1 Tax=Mycobacterium sp. KBS0706 TaxID=2578109 RepID=UPI00110F7160|nr:adenine nucleotide alpha hydrolase [Mycobacterium sp. KBS0706]TSD87223.1 adenine nucleotide alpha hydrolase [Mycobacterium sp. KBS0706]
MSTDRTQLEDVLDGLGPVAVAVSGGVDSMTLAVLAHRRRPDAVTMVHAVSPAVPPLATARVRDWAGREGWALTVLDAGEFADPRYRENPVNRCYFCKTNLYGAIAGRVAGTIVSGTNRDDLGEYRPGLDAAREHGVRHPYVEAGIGKAGLRALARDLGLGDLAELPSSPCLSSRVETLIPIEPEMLRTIDAVEQLVASRLRPRTVRCRVRAAGLVVELDPGSLAGLGEEGAAELEASIRAVLPAAAAARPLAFAPYRVGSAFVGVPG